MGEWGEANPSDVYYQALYPVDPSVVAQPDFHYLEAFQPIDLSTIGFEQSGSMSSLWSEAISDEGYILR